MAGRDQHGCMFAMVVRRCDDYRGGRNARFSQFFDRRENRDLKPDIIAKTTRARRIDIGQSGKLARMGFAGKFVEMKRVDRSHAAKAGDSDF